MKTLAGQALGPALLAVLFLLGACQRAPDIVLEAGTRDVYWAHDTFREVGARTTQRASSMFSVEVLPGPDGHTDILSRTLWFEAGGMNSLRLDRERGDQRAIADLLGAGTIARLDRKGRLVELRPRNPAAYKAALAQESRLAAALELGDGPMGLQAQALLAPAHSEPGREVRQAFQLPRLGELQVSMTLEQLQSGMGIWRLKGRSDAVTLDGIAVFPEGGGLPLEVALALRMTLPAQAPEKTPIEVEGRMQLISQRLEQGSMLALDDGLLDMIVEVEQERSPLFTAGAVLDDTFFFERPSEPDDWQDGDSRWLSDPQGLSVFNDGLYFRSRVPVDAEGEALLASDAQAYASRLTLFFDPMLKYRLSWPIPPRLDGVRLLDASGQPLPGLSVQVNRNFESMLPRTGSEIAWDEPGFPFRLPLDEVSDKALDGLARIEMDVRVAGRVERQYFDVPFGQQPPEDSGLSVDWQGERVMVRRDPLDGPDRLYLTPLDGQGGEMPSVVTEPIMERVLARLRGEPAQPWLSAWELGHEPLHFPLVTRRPLATLRIHTLRYERVPVTLVWRDVEPLLQGGELYGYRHAREQVLDRSMESVDAFLAGLDTVSLQDGDLRIASLLLPPDFSPVVADQACQVRGDGKPLRVSPVHYRDQSGEWRQGRGWALYHARSGDAFEIDCDRLIRLVREPLAESSCFRFEHGQLQDTGTCPVWREEPQTIRAIDEGGFALARVPRAQPVFWGVPTRVEYRRVEEIPPVGKRFVID